MVVNKITVLIKQTCDEVSEEGTSYGDVERVPRYTLPQHKYLAALTNVSYPVLLPEDRE